MIGFMMIYSNAKQDIRCKLELYALDFIIKGYIRGIIWLIKKYYFL